MYLHAWHVELLCLKCRSIFSFPFSKAKIIVNFLVHSSLFIAHPYFPFQSFSRISFLFMLFLVVTSLLLLLFILFMRFVYFYTHKRIYRNKKKKQVSFIQLLDNPLILNHFWCYSAGYSVCLCIIRVKLRIFSMHTHTERLKKKPVKFVCKIISVLFRLKQQLYHFVFDMCFRFIFEIRYWRYEKSADQMIYLVCNFNMMQYLLLGCRAESSQ